MKNFDTPLRRVLFLVFIHFALVTAFVFATRQRAAGPAAGQETPLAPLSGCTTPTFAAAANFGAGTSPQSVAAGDFNLDGKPDLVTANANSNNISVLLGNGAGSFGAATNFPVGVQPFGLTVGDFNQDGRPDLVTANTNASNVSLLLGDGAGGFGAATNFTVTGPFAVAVGDFNLDGKPDLAVARNFQVTLLPGNGTGGFAAPASFSAGVNLRSIAVGDFNLDGKPDVATTDINSNNVLVLLGNGAGSLGAAANFAVGNSPQSVAVGDFNQDGRPDLVTANTNSNSVSVLLGNGAGNFGAAANFTVGSGPQSVTAGDFNQDGKTDLVTANTSSDNVSVLLGNGLGSLGAAANFSAGDGSRAITAGDFNLDGRPDLATANQNSNNASMLLNTCNGTPCGSTAFGAATNFTAGTRPQSVTTGDFNQDGKTDLATPNGTTNNVSVLLGNGTGSFGAAANFTVGTAPAAVAAGDFNADGKSDLAVANFNSANVSVLLGNGAGSFGAAANFTVAATPISIVTGDFNQDGKTDLATANRNPSNVSILLGTGTGTFSAATNFAVGTNPPSIAAGDFNQDGKIDLATANQASNNVSVLLGNGAGSFGAATNFTVGTTPQSIAIGDFNNDGKSDLAAGNSVSNNVSVLLGNGAGSFGAATNFAVGTAPLALTGGDFNADGKPDLATANANSNNVSFLLGNGAGGFGAAANFAVGTAPDGIAAGDFDGDGLSDLAAANEISNDLTVLLNTCTPAPAMLTVNNTNDSGAGSLRQAILDSNNLAQVQTIQFNISGSGVQTINLVSALPTIADPVTIDGATQPGFAGAPLIELNGAGAGGAVNGLLITAGSSTVKSLIINRFTGQGIVLQTAGGNTVTGCYIGTDSAGATDLGNTGDGIRIQVGAANNTIGGLTATPGTAPGNVISGNNGNGIAIITNGGNVVQGNIIGLNAAGAAILRNEDRGVFINSAPSNTVGGPTATARNIISGHNQASDNGIEISGDAADGNIVQGNYIGTDLTGAVDLGNSGHGIIINAGDNTVIGGAAATTGTAPGNVISGNGANGINILAASTGTSIKGNLIGTNAAGTAGLGNALQGVAVSTAGTTVGGAAAGERNVISGNNGSGVILSVNCFVLGNFIGTNAAGTSGIPNNGPGVLMGAAGASNNQIGGTGAGEGNTIAFNITDGVRVAGGPVGNRILGNSIHTNGVTATHLGINLVGAFGVDPNDLGDPDTGSNNLQNFPVLNTATSNGLSTSVNGTLNSISNTTFRIEFFSNPSCDTAGNGEGRVFLGATNVTTDGGGNTAISRDNLINVAIGQVVTATATNITTNDTSEFSVCRAVTALAGPTITGRVADSNNQPLAGIAVALSGAASGTTQTDSNGNYAFTTLQIGGNYTVILNSPAYVFTPARADFTNLTANQTQNFTAQAGVVPTSGPPFADDFNAGGRDVDKWNLGILTQPPGSFDPNVTVSQATGQLVITPVANQTGLHFGGYVSVNNLDVSGGQVSVELVQAGTGGAQSLFSIGTDYLNFSRFLVQSPTGNQPLIIEEVINGVKQAPFEGTMPIMIFQLVQNGVVFLNVAIPYDPIAQRFLRFRHLARDANNNPANLLVFETSPDASVWTERARGDLGERSGSVSAITVELAGGTAGLAGNPGPIIFDNLVTQVVNARFALAAVTVSEGAGAVTLNVTRTGLTNLAGTMEYSTQDGTATQRTRYVAASGVLPFASGETSKSFQILLQDNALVDGSQDFNVFLGPGQGMGVNGPGRVIVTITDNDTPPITTNPLETPSFFVTQQYYDFLSRQPDAAGLAFWVGQIVDPCGGNAACISQRRWNVSNAFFFELEFQQTGSFVYRLYRAAYGNTQPFPNTSGDMDAHPFCTANPANCQLIRAAHVPNYAKFINDRARLDAGNLAATQLALANAFALRSEFRQRYPVTQTAAQFVDALLANIQTASGANLTAQRDALIALHGSGGRGAVLYRLADDNTLGNPINNRSFIDAEYSRSFVLTQYFGYLRRDPDMPGLNFWLGIINRFPLRAPTGQNAMVCAFITSGEYQTRFSAVVTRTDSECPTPP